MKRFLMIIVCLCLLVSCTKHEQEKDVGEENNNENVDIRIGCTTYPSSYAQAMLLDEILTRKGYSSKIVLEDTDTMWKSLGNGKVDVVLSSWIPTIDTRRRSKIQSSIIDLGTNCRNLSNGIFVPEYTQIGFLSELGDYQNKFSKRIYVCKGSDITIQETEVMLENYKAHYEIVEVNSEELDDLIQKSINNEEWIAIALWTPNGKIDKYNLRQLRDTIGIYTCNIDMHTLINNQYSNSALVTMLDNYFIRTGELNELIHLLNENNHEKKIVTTWLDNNLHVMNRLEP